MKNIKMFLGIVSILAGIYCLLKRINISPAWSLATGVLLISEKK